MSSIPVKANTEVMKTVQMPLRPLANAPGSSPIDSLLCVLAWWSIDQWQMQIDVVVVIVIVVIVQGHRWGCCQA